MKKVICSILTMFLLMTVSCSKGNDKASVSKGYDQASVDRLQKKMENMKEGEHLSKADYQTAIEQLNYILDELEQTDDLMKYEENNKQKAESYMVLSMVLAFGQMDDTFPSELNKDCDAINKRSQKILERVNVPSFDNHQDFSGYDMVEVDSVSAVESIDSM